MKSKKNLWVGLLIIFVLFLFVILLLSAISFKKLIPTHEANNYDVIKNKKKTYFININDVCEKAKPCFKKISGVYLNKKFYELNINIKNDEENHGSIAINQKEIPLLDYDDNNLEMVGVINRNYLIYTLSSKIYPNTYSFVLYDKNLNPLSIFHSYQDYKINIDKQFDYKNNELTLYNCMFDDVNEDGGNILVTYTVNLNGVKPIVNTVNKEPVDDCGVHQ